MQREDPVTTERRRYSVQFFADSPQAVFLFCQATLPGRRLTYDSIGPTPTDSDVGIPEVDLTFSATSRNGARCGDRCLTAPVHHDGLLEHVCFWHGYLSAGRSHTSIRDALQYVWPYSDWLTLGVLSLRFVFCYSFLDTLSRIDIDNHPACRLRPSQHSCVLHIGIRLH